MFKIIIIIIGYTLNNFHYSYHNIIIDDGGKKCNFKFYKGGIHFLEKKIFVLLMWKLTLDYSIGK
jgi:hypothetical protein